jgi:exportin-5
MPLLTVEAQFTVVEAALKSYMKWRLSPRQWTSEEVCPLKTLWSWMESNLSQDQEMKTLETNFEVWCDRLLETSFEVGIKIPSFNSNADWIVRTP